MTHSPQAAPGGTALAEPPLVDMRGIRKTFGGVVACDGVDFSLRRGEVHALLGENGAGKSTLMNILSGAVGDYQGEIAIGGSLTHLGLPARAQAAGISIIHQELDLVPSLSVAENLVLGHEPRTWWRGFDRARADRAAAHAVQRLRTAIDPRSRVGELRIGEQQLIAIARALASDARILIMDEPTSALGQAEAERLFSVIQTLREQGVGIIYISHRLDEVLSLADRVTVLRDGRNVGTVLPAQSSARDIVTMMVGRPVDDRTAGDPVHRSGDGDTTALLALTDLAVHPRRPRPGRTEPAGVSLTVRPGEIVGLAGLMGAGRTELLETIFGAGSGRRTGVVNWRGRPARFRSPRGAVAAGVCFVPEDRKAAGLFAHHSVAANLSVAALGRVARLGLVSRTRERSLVEGSLRRLRVRTEGVGALVAALSGGNQQKIVIGRQLLTEPRLLLLDDPTRGVDVGAKAEIHRVLRELAGTGLGVLLASSELPELVGVCDRVLVLRGGQVVAEWPTEELSEERILAAAQGEST